MASKRKKQTPLHAKHLKRVRQFISRAEKRGYKFSDSLKQELYGYSTQKLKSLTPEKLYKEATYLDQESDRIISGTQGKKKELSVSAKKGAQTRRIKRQSKEREYYPDGGETIFNNVYDEYISRLSAPSIKQESRAQEYGEKAEEVIERLQTPTPEFAPSNSGRGFYHRSSQVISESERQKNFLLNLTFQVAREIGISALGWRLQERANDVSALVEYVLYGSYVVKIQSAATELTSIIVDGPLTGDQQIAIAEQEEYNEDWNPPE